MSLGLQGGEIIPELLVAQQLLRIGDGREVQDGDRSTGNLPLRRALSPLLIQPLRLRRDHSIERIGPAGGHRVLANHLLVVAR